MKIIKRGMVSLAAAAVKLGRALMLPIAVLPIAGLLLRLGQPDVLNVAFISAAGSAVFNNLPIIFAIGVAIGFARESHGAAALAACIGYFILTAALKTLDSTIDMGVMGGIIIGVLSGVLYNRYHAIKLPPYLAFFGGRRFVPIVTGAASLLVAVLAYFIWPPIGHAISAFGHWIIASGNIGLFFYGVANRLLIPLGLHHILNNLVQFQFGDFATVQNGIDTVIHGDIYRFFAGDPTAGAFLAGFFPVMMFGLPAACLAMIHTAHTTRKKAAVGLLLSMALTSFLTGITEPIEFAFLFLAFPLYLIHAVLTGLSMVIMNVLHVKLGFTFSAGLFDYVLGFGISTRPWWLIPVGLVYGVIYYTIFRFAIVKWNLKTPGREDDPVAQTPATPTVQPVAATTVQPSAPSPANDTSRGARYVAALGGKENIRSCGACATRLRLEVNDVSRVNEANLKALGALGIVKTASGQVQIVIGPEVEFVYDEIKPYLN